MDDKNFGSPNWLIGILLKISAVVTVVEGIIMFILLPLLKPYIPPALTNLLDPLILILVSGPIIAKWSIEPYIKRRDLLEQEVKNLKIQADVEHNKKEKALHDYSILLEQAVAEATYERERYKMVERASNDGLWDWYSNTDVSYFSPRFKNIFGFTDDEFPNDGRTWFSRVHPDHKPKIKEAIQAALVADDGCTGSYNYQAYHKDGHLMWLQSRWIKVNIDKGYRLAGTLTDITESKQAQDDLVYTSLHDILTGLPNRRLFNDRLQQEILRLKRNPKEKFAVLFIDVDNFKRLNDSLGHNAGDRVLKIISERLRQVLRETDTVSRFGGDEFAILISDIGSKKLLKECIERFIEAVKEPASIDGVQLNLGISVGVVLCDRTYKGSTPEKILMDADIALYKTKDSQRGTYSFFNLPMRNKVNQQFEIENTLRNSFHASGIFLHYQPIVDTKSQEIVGFEALMRLNHPRYGVIPPTVFIAIAEESELIIQLGDFAIEEATKQLAHWQKLTLNSNLFMSINVSGRQFQMTNVAEKIQQACERNGILPSSVHAEMTETVLASNVQMVHKNIDMLHDLGVRLSLDDFGKGYSSLATLSRYPFNILKIDKAFINDIVHDKMSCNMIENLVTIARTRNMTTIAEGVETLEQVKLLESLGCQKIQGYYFSRPLSADDLNHLLPQSMCPTAWGAPDGQVKMIS